MKIDLNSGWKLRHEPLFFCAETPALVLSRKNDWMEVSLPCDVHVPLIECGAIPEPLEKDNFKRCEWIEQRSWWFLKEFDLSGDLFKNGVFDCPLAELSISSLDCGADIWLNDAHIGRHDSAFYPYEKDIRRFARPGKNILLVRLTCGLDAVSEKDASELSFSAGPMTDDAGFVRGDRRRIMIRKPQFCFGWDWAPRVATCGITGGAQLNIFESARIANLHLSVTELCGADAKIKLTAECDYPHPFATAEGTLEIKIKNPDGDVALAVKKELYLRSGINTVVLNEVIENALLWWPNGMGGQPLYTVEANIACGGVVTPYDPFFAGLRMLALNTDKINENENMFAVVINGVNVTCKGGNWIPADSVYGRVTPEKYETLVSEAAFANFNMLRIWGGGLYEPDVFYEACARRGILVWQDFMFSCALYPDRDDKFLREVEREIEYQTRRLSKFASLAVFSGNNENTWGFHEWWPDADKTSYFGGEKIYNYVAPRAVARNCPEIPYWNCSPYGGPGPNCSEQGDRHHWHDGTMNPDMQKRITPQEYDKITSKFISEYGYIGPCRRSSIEKYHGGEKADKNGPIWKLHNNTFEKATVPEGIRKHYATPEGLSDDEYLLYAGLCQSLMYRYSLEAIRCVANNNGSLFWMYNDCWGEVGWTIIDYYLTRKISFYGVRRAFEPVKLILREKDGKINLFAANETQNAVNMRISYGYVSYDGVYDCREADIPLAARSKGVVLSFERDSTKDETRGVFFARADDASVTPALLYGKPFRALSYPKPVLTVEDVSFDGSDTVFTVSSDVFAHAVHFGLPDETRLSDEYFDLLPGEKRRVRIFGGNYGDIAPKSIIPQKID